MVSHVQGRRQTGREKFCVPAGRRSGRGGQAGPARGACGTRGAAGCTRAGRRGHGPPTALDRPALSSLFLSHGVSQSLAYGPCRDDLPVTTETPGASHRTLRPCRCGGPRSPFPPGPRTPGQPGRVLTGLLPRGVQRPDAPVSGAQVARGPRPGPPRFTLAAASRAPRLLRAFWCFPPAVSFPAGGLGVRPVLEVCGAEYGACPGWGPPSPPLSVLHTLAPFQAGSVSSTSQQLAELERTLLGFNSGGLGCWR